MDSLQIGTLLAQDGLTTGAIYALLGMALVLLFSVTRVIFFGQGEFVAFGALTLALLQDGRVPGTVWLLLALSLVAGLLEAVAALRAGSARRLPRIGLVYVVLPLALAALVVWTAPRGFPLLAQAALSLALVTPIGTLLYRLVYQPVADASVLVLLIVSVGVHFVLAGFALLFFGVDGFRTPPFWDGRLELGSLSFTGQSVIVLAVTGALIVLLGLGFQRTLYGKALRAAASNSTGAQLVAISVPFAGSLSFTIAAVLGALCGLLIGPIVTIYYDSGLLIGLKGFVAAIFGGLASYGATLLGALAIGVVESFASFLASAYK
ncbi:MAG: branched-chain amino acid ABC transporter permease, partial [Pseudoxanthomonas sp.]